VRTRGARRPYRVPLRDASLEVEGTDVVVARFTLPPGAFATVVMEELMKPRRHPEAAAVLAAETAEGAAPAVGLEAEEPLGVEDDPDEETSDGVAGEG
jgi:hypothetical protein